MSARLRDIVVVGGGPVGAAAARALADQGFDVVLIERGAPPPAFDRDDYDARVYAIAPRSARFLAGLGAWEDILAKRACSYRSMRVWEQDAGSGLRFDAADAARPQLGWIVEHRLIVAALWERLQGLEVRSRCAIESARFDEEGAELRLAGGGLIRARLAVAADGGDSQLRRLAGIDSVGWAYDQRAIVCHVDTEKLHRGTAWQRFLRTGPLAFLPLADGRSSIVWSAQPELADALLALDSAGFCGRLQQAAEQVLGAVTGCTPRLSFPLRLAHAADYVRPGLALAGDAAHSLHPMAGQGVNLGLGDAEQLVATLAAARAAGREWWSLRSLQAYARARKAANLEMQALTELLYRAFALPVPGVRAALGAGLAAVDRLGPLKSWLSHQAAEA